LFYQGFRLRHHRIVSVFRLFIKQKNSLKLHMRTFFAEAENGLPGPEQAASERCWQVISGRPEKKRHSHL